MAREPSRAEERLRAVVEGLASKTGDEFFRSLVRHLAAALGVKYVFVGETGPHETQVVRSLAVWGGDEFGEDFEYQIEGTPCEGVVNQTMCFYPKGIQQLFPRDQLLASMGAESYLGTPLFDSSQRPLGLLVAMHDTPMDADPQRLDLLTMFAARAGTELERMRVEEALRESEQRTLLIIDTTLDAVITIDARSRVTGWNARAVSIFGWSESEALGRDLAELIIPSELRGLHRSGVAHFLETGEGPVLGRRIELEGLHKSGRRFPIELSIATIQTGDSFEFSAFLQDISERKRAEEDRAKLESQIQYAQKLESLGVLAGGIAHDFNNLLTGILASAGTARRQLPEDHPAQPQLAEVVQGSKIASRLSAQLLDYAGKGTIQSRPLDLGTELRELEPLLKTAVRGRARLELETVDALPAIEADPVQIQQVVMNLVINAAESVQEEVHIRVCTHAVELGPEEISELVPGSSLGPGHRVALDVEDDGCGLDGAAQMRIFDPFFTTKATGRGLGLAAALGIVNQHGGGIQLRSTPGVGTRFRILFPVSEKPVEALPERSAVDLSGHGVVLVVDDDEFVLRAASIVLESFGYSVILAGDGSTCVARFRERPSEIDLVVLDLNMQGMSGEETLEALRAIRPDVRVLLSTGFDENDAEQRLAGGFVGFLSKPYEPEELASAVRRILGTEQEPPSDFDSEFAVLKAQYKRKLPDKLHELETAIRAAQARDAPESALHEACRQVHSLMGTSGSYGFEDAAAALQILDAALREILERSFTGEEAWARVEDALTRVREIGSQLDRSASQ